MYAYGFYLVNPIPREHFFIWSSNLTRLLFQYFHIFMYMLSVPMNSKWMTMDQTKMIENKYHLPLDSYYGSSHVPTSGLHMAETSFTWPLFSFSFSLFVLFFVCLGVKRVGSTPRNLDFPALHLSHTLIMLFHAFTFPILVFLKNFYFL